MKKVLMTLSACALITTAACAGEGNVARDVYPENGNTINVTERNEHYNHSRVSNENEMNSNFGFVRHQDSPVPNGMNYNGPALNREGLADAISRLEVSLPTVRDAATLVTDEEVLIAYDTNATSEQERFEVADQVKKTALSLVPRYYHVYVSDNPRMFRDIERFGALGTDEENIESSLSSTIKDMLNSPQGRKMSNGENENGEYIGEVNDEISEDFNTPMPRNVKQ